MYIKITRIAFLLIFVVSGCGSDGDDENDVNTCKEVISCPSGATLGGFLEWLSGACTTSTVCSSDQVWPDWDDSAHEESEPNNALNEAIPVFVGSGGDLVHIFGNISPSDTVDYVAFSTAYDRTATIYICKTQNECNGMVYSGDAAYLDILDANGNSLVSTAPPLGPGSHEILMTFTPMQLYYVRIVKDNLIAGVFEYRFVIANGLTR